MELAFRPRFRVGENDVIRWTYKADFKYIFNVRKQFRADK